MIDFFIIIHTRSTSKKIKLAKLSYRFYEVRGNFFKNINEYKNYNKLVCIDFVTFLGLGTPTWCIFFEKILPIIVLEHNLQLSLVKFVPICVPMIR